MSTLIFILCMLFLLGCLGSVFIQYMNNPYMGSNFFVDAAAGADSPLYISKVVVIDGLGKPVYKFKRVSCVPGQSYTKSVSDWFYNTFEHEPLINFVKVNEDQATSIYKKHRKYTNQVAAS